MRIALDVSPITAMRTGVGNYCYYLLKHLLAMETGDIFLGFSSGSSRVELGAMAGKVTHRHFPLPTRAVYQLWNHLAWPKVDTWLGGADVYHATNYFLAPTQSARRVVSVHDLAFWVKPHLCSPKISGLFAKYVGRFIREADAVIACSESTKADILKFCPVDTSRVRVVYDAVDDDFAAMDRNEARQQTRTRFALEGPYILFVGTLEPRKNLPLLLKAFARIATDLPHTLVLAGGTGWNAGPIFETLESLNLGNRVRRLGFVRTASDLSALYSAADAFAFPSHYEGFGLPILEAMTCGCPVVATDNSSIPEVAGGAALLCPSDDEESFAEALRATVSDAALRARLSDAGRKQAARFSWRLCAEQTRAVYRQVLSA